MFVPARLQSVKEIPTGPGWLYEPKLDGYRGLLVSSEGGKGSLWSRNDKDLGRFFPELIALASRMPRATVLDGEIVMPTAAGVSFLALQQRLAAIGRESPVAFIAFDVLRSGDDLRRELLSHRRRRLERVVDHVGESSLQLMTQTPDLEAAATWLDEELSIAGIEGAVAKLDEPYPKPESRRWRKIRRVSTSDFVVRGFIPEPNASLRLVLATDDSEPRLVGTTYPISGVDLQPLARFVTDATPAEQRIWAPFDEGRREWFQLPPDSGLIAEVIVTTIDSGVLRQPARFVRWRAISPPKG